MVFWGFIVFLIGQRFLELLITRSNEKWLLTQGAIEYGKEHFPYMVIMHILFIISLLVEYLTGNRTGFSIILLIIYAMLLVLKIWTISSLGKYWNIKIYRIPKAVPVKRGPYKFMKHPNYFIVICELIVIPLAFHLYYTAIIFSLLNALMIRIRIRTENTVWDYS
jgi:methyltransferase